MYHKIAPLGITIMACAAATAQAQLPDNVCQAFEAYIASAEQLAPVLKGVTDKESADASTEPMKKAMTSVYHAHNGMRSIQSLTPAQTELVRQQYEQRMREQWGNVYEQIFRLNKTNCYQSPSFSKLFHVMCMMLNQ